MIYGFKSLVLHGNLDQFVLKSPMYQEFWAVSGYHPEENIAYCQQGRMHKSPNDECNCGIYAAFDLHEIYQYVSHGEEDAFVVLVGGSGKVIIKEKGWVAEKAILISVINILSAKFVPRTVAFLTNPFSYSYYSMGYEVLPPVETFDISSYINRKIKIDSIDLNKAEQMILESRTAHTS